MPIRNDEIPHATRFHQSLPAENDEISVHDVWIDLVSKGVDTLSAGVVATFAQVDRRDAAARISQRNVDRVLEPPRGGAGSA